VRELKPGDLIADRYRIGALIARGGMGAVHRGTDERTGRAVAIKVLLRELADDRTSVARFEREVTAAARLDHPGVVSVIDFGTTPDGVSYLVMEHVSGRTLASVLDQGRLAPSRAADIVEQALGALAAAHAAGIVHRDLKPANLMLVPAGAGGREIVKLFDFGIAQLKTSSAFARLTAAGSVIGTPAYMSPEQARGGECDARTDIYAMGMVLWCCLTGTRAFTGREVDVLLAVQNVVPPRADQVVPDVPAELATIAARALAKRPEDRFQSAAELAAALVAARTSMGTVAAPQPGANVTTLMASPSPLAPLTPTLPEPAAPEPPRASPPSPPPSPPRRRIWPRVLAVVVVLGLGASVLVVGVVAYAMYELGVIALWAPPALPYPGARGPVPAPLPAPFDPSVGPSADIAPSGGPVCTRALGCCEAYSQRVAAMGEPCPSVVLSDEAGCQGQLDMWRQWSDDQGVTLAECAAD
jgi:serine/threonine protein kinase